MIHAVFFFTLLLYPVFGVFVAVFVCLDIVLFSPARLGHKTVY